MSCLDFILYLNIIDRLFGGQTLSLQHLSIHIKLYLWIALLHGFLQNSIYT